MSHRAKRTAGWSVVLVACALIAARLAPMAARQVQSDRSRAATQAAGATTTRLADGRWLVVGGDGAEGRAQTWDPQAQAATPTATPLQTPRAGHTATLLSDGTVLIVGGRSGNGLAELPELFDPASGAFTPVPMGGATARMAHSTTLLTDGRVLIVGGTAGDRRALATEIWDVAAQTVTPVANLTVGRTGHSATLTADGRVLVSGGRDLEGKSSNDAIAIDPATGTTAKVESATEPRTVPAVADTMPESGAIEVPLDAHVTVRFTAALSAESLTPETLVLTGPNGSIATRVVPAEDGRLAFVWPSERLSEHTTYTLIVSGPADVAGVPVTPASVVFTTTRLSDSSAGASAEDWTPDASWRTNRPPSPWQNLLPLEAPAGVTALSGQILKLDGEPLPDVQLQVEKRIAHSDRTGRFLVGLDGLATQHVELWIDGRTASRPGATYGSYEVGVDIQGGRTTILPYTIWSTKLDTAHAVAIPSPTPSETVVRTPAIPGLELRLPAGTVIRDHEGKPVTSVSITPVPLDRPPFPLPAGVRVPVYFTIQPGGGYVYVAGTTGARGARLIYPNGFHLPPAFGFEFWRYDPDGPGWQVYGRGAVTPDGQQVAPNPGVEIYEFTGAMAAPPNLSPGTGPNRGGKKDGDPVDLYTGLFVLQKTDIALPDVIPIALTRTYRPGDARSRAFGIGASHPYDLFLVGDTFPYTYLDLVFEDGGKVHFARTNCGQTCDSDYANAQYSALTTPTEWYGANIHWIATGGGWLLTKKDGTAYRFPDGFLAGSPQQAALIGITDRFGNTVTLTRDANHNLTQVRSPSGRFLNVSYDPANATRIAQVQDNVGRTVAYEYDTSGRLWKVTDPEGGVTTYTYDSAHRMQTLKDARGIIYLMNQYDANDRVIKQVLPDGGTYQFAYTVDGQGRHVTSVTNPRGYVTQTTFNSAGFPTIEVEAVSTSVERTTTTNRDAGTNHVNSVIDGLSRETDYTYYDSGRVHTVTRAAGTSDEATTTFEYEPLFAQLSKVIDPLQHAWTITYDGTGRMTGTTDPLGHHTTIALNSAGQVTSVTDPLSHQWQYGYTDGDVTSTSDPLNHVTNRFFDGAGRLLTRTDPLGRTTRTTYDKLNRPTLVIDPINGQTALNYDPNGNLLSLTDASNHTTGYTYDLSDRLATRTDPLLATATHAYDSLGNATQSTDRMGQITRYQLDPLDRISQVTYPDGTTTTYTYDAGNRVTEMVDSVGGTITRTYDRLDRMTGETTPEGGVTFTYDADGRRSTLTVVGQPQVTYNYDDAHRLSSVTQGATAIGFTYDDANRRSTLSLSNGIVATYGLDGANRLASLTYSFGQLTLGTITYTYDEVGNQINSGGSWSRTGLPAAMASATYDAANRLQTWATQSVSYDANGNLTSNAGTRYQWNVRGQLSGLSGAVSASFAYDGFARRRSKTLGGTSISFLYDGINVAQELAGTTPTANLLLGLGIDESYARTDANGTFTPLVDALGSTIALADSSGVVQTQYTFEPFGTTAVSGLAISNSFQFAGRENDATGIYYNRARYYAPGVGRFAAEDPIGFFGGTNLYAYAGANPVRYIDPLGWSRKDPCPTCIDVFVDCLTDWLLPGLSNVVQGFMEAYASTASIYEFNTAVLHALGRGLTYPQKSSIFRDLIQNSRWWTAAAEAAGPLVFTGGVLWCLGKEMNMLARGECTP